MTPAVCCLINPRSGNTNGERLYREWSSKLPAHAPDVCLELLDARQVSEQVQRARSAQLVLIAGGDGTVGSLLPHFMGARARVGVIPLRTGNDLARELRSRELVDFTNPMRTFRAFREAGVKRLTLWEVQWGPGEADRRIIANYVSIGSDARVVATFSAARDRGTALSAEHSDASDDLIELVIAPNWRSYFSMMGVPTLPGDTPTVLRSSTEWRLSGLPPSVAVQCDGEHCGEVNSGELQLRRAGMMDVITSTEKG